jgi:hypothetical protein
MEAFMVPCRFVLVAVACVSLGATLMGRSADSKPVTWLVDNLATIGGHKVTVEGTPRVVSTPQGDAVEFNGATDGLYLDVNPLEGLKQFTVEMMLEPAIDGQEEQRFLHISQNDADNRALIELRLTPDRTWCLDTYLRMGPPGLTLIDRNTRHDAGTWHTVALTYDGQTMTHYVDGKKELEGQVAFGPLGPGRVSIGVRQNKVSWFKGRIRLVRITPAALSAAQLLTVPAT